MFVSPYERDVGANARLESGEWQMFRAIYKLTAALPEKDEKCTFCASAGVTCEIFAS